jgi:nucleoid DNA-binding protein
MSRMPRVEFATTNWSVSRMATAKKATAKAAPKKAAPKAAKSAPKAAPKAAKPAAKPVVQAPSALKPIKETFNKTSLVNHLVQTSGADAKTVKAVLGSLEATILASIAKKGAGAFTWPGVLKVSALQVPAKKARKGIDPFTKVERMFAAKPASVKVKARFFKKVKDAAL